MSQSICSACRATLRRSLRIQNHYSIISRRAASSKPETPLDITALLSKPTWSVRSLLPPANEAPAQEITPEQLRHLLRLSALPEPKSQEEEDKMLETLHAQLHFVRDIQSVNTEGVKPLQSIRDESEEGIKEATIGLADLKEALDSEVITGRMRRPRRRRTPVDAQKVENWDVTGCAERKVETPGGKYFVVRTSKK